MFDLRIALLALAIGSASPSLAGAQSAAPAPDPFATFAPADCRIVDATDIARILGFTVAAPDASSASGGVCFYTTRAVSQEGSAAYAIVDSATVARRRGYFIAATRRCGSVAKGAPNELICRSYRRLAEATDLDAYFKARTDYDDAVALPELGAAAVAAPDAVYVRRGDTIFECVVRRGEFLDVPRSTELARLLLERFQRP